MVTIDKPLVLTDSTIEPVEKKFKPVKAFAIVGVLFFALEAYILIDWIAFSGKFKRTPQGPTPIPGFMRVGANFLTIIGAFAFIFCIYFFIIRPLRKNGRLSLDSLLAICFIFIYWQDPLLNYTTTVSTYNTVFLNYGSWTQSLPGWLSPRGSLMAEPILWSGPFYLYAVFTACISANWAMKRFKAKRPQTSAFGLFMYCFTIFAVVDFISECIWLRLGLYTYAGTVPWLTVFKGHYYQFPLYEIVIGGVCWAGFASLRYFRNDKGQTVAERGIDEIRGTQKQKTWIRFLALWGVINLIFLLGYNLPHQFFAIHSGPWPKDITSRSYLTDGFCGPLTTYACAGPDVPIPRPNSSHVSPQGTLVGPDTKNTPIFISPGINGNSSSSASSATSTTGHGAAAVHAHG